MGKAAKGPEYRLLFKKAQNGDSLSLGRLLTLVESDLRSAAPFLASLEAKAAGIRVGITGPPGAGKSSLINLLISKFRDSKKTVAVLAVDPSSPFSGGALLGDRVRMNTHAGDKGVFIRSIGSRGGFGGLSVATGAMATVIEACGFDIVIIETVGVGQTELQVMNLADVTGVVLVPESGDVIQTLKAGILEIADLFIVNKSDRAGSETLVHELINLVEQESRKRPVLKTSVPEKSGIDELASELTDLATKFKKTRRRDPERLREELRHLLLWDLDQDFRKKISKLKIDRLYGTFSKFRLPFKPPRV